MSNKYAFTLVEILTVIGIIGLLTAILLPVFLKARGQSHKATCQSNLRQVYLALHHYVEDNDGAWPEGDTWGDRSFTSVKLNGCPQAVPPSSNYNASLSGVSGYAYNTAFNTVENGHTVGVADHAIRYPATTVAVCEEAIGRQRSYGPNPFFQVTPGRPAGEEEGWLRHNGGANYLFADGHVKWYPPDAVGYNDGKKNTGATPTFSL